MKHPALIVFAKTPVPGRVKTRLCPPLTPEQACRLYTAFLSDILGEAARLTQWRRVIAYAGDPDWFAPWRGDFELLEQQGADLGERLLHAFEAVGTPAVGIGSDSPHLDSEIYRVAAERLEQVPVVIGPCTDGGYYLIALARPVDLFTAMPMGTDRLLAATLGRGRNLDLAMGLLCEDSDIDTWADVQAVRARLPAHSRQTLAAIEAELAR
ncbi:MAG: TIGR04282 family arsenosugar biosynthesis glycosyltransferase [Aphanocapsa lilacina HA4352-LM1]|nr:TIGR04282 family arsenosugar biosynthesis glycosyltransferase [Aphanocapsa lilacina HA4352-LM1]